MTVDAGESCVRIPGTIGPDLTLERRRDLADNPPFQRQESRVSTLKVSDMPTGIDVGSRTIHVATPDGVRRYWNGIRRAGESGDEDADDGDGWDDAGDSGDAGQGDDADDANGRLKVETADGTYVVEPGTGNPDRSVGRLFGDGGAADADAPSSVRTAVAEAFLERVADDAEDAIRYVDAPQGSDPLAAVAAGAGHVVAPLDPGLAVCYDVLDAPATGLGVAVGADRAVATLATAGVPVATATVDIDGDWYDLPDAVEGHSGAGATGDGTTADWLARQYATLFAELGADLAAGAPALDGPVPVAVGGSAAPASADGDRFGSALAAGFPFAVGPVTVAADPAGCPARGALAAAEADGSAEAPIPAFAVDVPFVDALADFGDATAAFGAAARARPPADPDETPDGAGDVPGPSGAVAAGTAGGGVESGVERAVAGARADVATLDRRGAMTARGLSDVVERLDGRGGADGDAVATLRADLDELAERLPEEGSISSLDGDLADELDAVRESVAAVESDLDRLTETAATAEAVADLESSLDSLDEAVAELESDVDSVRDALTGLEDGEAAVAGEALEDLAVDALREDVEELRADVGDRVDDVWSAVDDLEARLVDVEATAGDVPDLESTVESVRNRAADLEDGTASLRESVDSLRSDLDAVRAETASTDDVAAVETDVQRVADDVDALRTELRETEWVEPATVDQLETDLEGLRGTLITRADRLEELEETTEQLRERIETVYGNSAKSEALASLESETARVRNTAAKAMERTNEMSETVSDLDETVADHADQLGMVSTNVDNLAGSSVTRAEMESSVADVEERLDQLEADIRADLDGVRSLADEEADVEPVETGTSDLVVGLQAAAFVFLGLFGATLALLSSVPFNAVIAAGFVMFSVLPAVLAWLVN